MTDLLLDPNDTGEIPTQAGEATQNLAPYMENPPALRLALTEPTAEIRIPQTIAVVDEPVDMQRHLDAGFAQPIAPPERVDGFDGPQPPPPPLPPIPPSPDGFETARLNLLDSLAEAPAQVRVRRSVPYVMPADRKPFTGARHLRRSPRWTRWAVQAGVVLAAYAAGWITLWAVSF